MFHRAKPKFVINQPYRLKAQKLSKLATSLLATNLILFHWNKVKKMQDRRISEEILFTTKPFLIRDPCFRLVTDRSEASSEPVGPKDQV